MTGGDSSVNAADNTQELAELFDATLKFTSVLKKKGVSQSTLTVGCWNSHAFNFAQLTLQQLCSSYVGSSAMPALDAEGKKLGLSAYHQARG